MNANAYKNKVRISKGDGDDRLSLYEDAKKFLKDNRGFTQFADRQFASRYKTLLKNHHQFSKRTSRAGDTLCYAESHSACLEFDFGNSKNALGHGCLGFFLDGDERNKDESYVTQKIVDLEVDRFLSFLSNLGVCVSRSDNERLTPKQIILKNESENTHIHGGAKSLEEIKSYVESINEDGRRNHNYECNSWDRDKNRILCGQIKYFYNYSGILCRGQVWHHINNMWWVLTDGGKSLNNIASFNLFDYSGEPTRKAKSPKNAVLSLTREMEKYQKSQDFEKCIILRDKIRIIKKNNEVVK